MKRRHFLAGGAAALGLGWWLRPEDQGQGGHDAYFSSLQAQLKQHGLARPTLLPLAVLQSGPRWPYTFSDITGICSSSTSGVGAARPYRSSRRSMSSSPR